MMMMMMMTTTTNVVAQERTQRLLLTILIIASIVQASSANSAEACCRRLGVSQFCADKLCRPDQPPGLYDMYTLFERRHNCTKHLHSVGECLADGRDASSCCQSEALDRDEDVCLSLCQGSAGKLDSAARYQTCLALNLPSMMGCLLRAYKAAPGPPQRPRLVHSTPDDGTTLRVEWSEPSVNAAQVHVYRAIVKDETRPSRPEIVKETSRLGAVFEGLQGGRRYSVRIVAVASDQKWSSQASDVLYFTTKGKDSPASASQRQSNKVRALRTLVTVARTANRASLGCVVHLEDSEELPQVSWRRTDKNEPLRGSKHYTYGAYESNDETSSSRVLVAWLEVKQPDSVVDGGSSATFECDAGSAGSVQITLSIRAQKPSSSPPDTPLECCSKQAIRAECKSACAVAASSGFKESGATQKRHLKPGAFLPLYRCIPEMQSLMRCTVSGLNDAGCCMRKKVPFHCLGLCDDSLPMPDMLTTDCAAYTDKVVDCRDSQLRPSAVDNLRAVKQDDGALLVDWSKSDKAEHYLLYHRPRYGTDWTVEELRQTSARLPSSTADIVVIATNGDGRADGARLAYADGQWSGNY